MVDTEYQTDIEHWRADMEEKLRAEDGWLALIGLFWLAEGDNTIGSGPSCVVALPADRAPVYAGTVRLENGTLTLRTGPGMLVNGEPVEERSIRADKSGAPDIITIGDFSMFVLQRGARFGMRVRDKNHPMRKAFTGRLWYPVNDAYRVEATFVPYDPPKPIAVANILGDIEEQPCPGYLLFTLDGQQLSMDVTGGGKGQISCIFHDLTSGRTTYPPGRFVVATLPEAGPVTLDFNRAYSPPCAFTEFATCPLPPPQNWLRVAIEAGELYDGQH